MTPAKNKAGRPPLEPGKRRKQTSVSMTSAEKIAFLRLGGSRWLRGQIAAAIAAESKRKYPE